MKTILHAIERDAIRIAIASLEAELLELCSTMDRGKDRNGRRISINAVIRETDDKTSALVILHEMLGTTPKAV